MKIKSIAPWFGGKRTLAPAIIKQLGEHVQYFEPFCGSMSVLLAKPPSRNETVNDLHGDMINLAKIVADPDLAPNLYSMLTRAVICEGLLDEARDILSEPCVVGTDVATSTGRAYWYFLASWMGRNGTAGCERQDYQIAVRWTAEGGSPVTRWRSAIDSIPPWHARLQNVVILNRDAFTMLHKFEDHERTAIYVDSPYLMETRTSGDSPGGRYLHDFKSEGDGLFSDGDDHSRLAEVLNRYKRSRIVVSYYDHPRLRSLYEGWTFIDCMRKKNINQQQARGKFAAKDPQDAPEVLIVNGDPL